MDALKEGGIVIWVDGDTEYTAPFKEQYVLSIIGPYLSYMGRERHHSCSSFVAWNTEHSDHAKFMEVYTNLYDGRGLYKEKEWHDAYILDVAIRKSGVNAKNLCSKIPSAYGSQNVFDLVFPMGHHKKGNRKFGEKGG